MRRMTTIKARMMQIRARAANTATTMMIERLHVTLLASGCGAAGLGLLLPETKNNGIGLKMLKLGLKLLLSAVCYSYTSVPRIANIC